MNRSPIARITGLSRQPMRRRVVVTGPVVSVRLLVRTRAGRRCEVCATTVGLGQVHHRKPRRMGGTHNEAINTPANLLLLCPPCHAWTESHRSEAHDLGRLLHDRQDPASTPVRLRHGWVLLTDDGHYRKVAR